MSKNFGHIFLADSHRLVRFCYVSDSCPPPFWHYVIYGQILIKSKIRQESVRQMKIVLADVMGRFVYLKVTRTGQTIRTVTMRRCSSTSNFHQEIAQRWFRSKLKVNPRTRKRNAIGNVDKVMARYSKMA